MLKNSMLVGVASLAAVAVAGTTSAQYLLVGVDSGDHLDMLSAFDGSLITSEFIDLDVAFQPVSSSTKPWNATSVGNEIWVTDESRDNVYRLDSNGNHLGAISGVDDPAGLTQVGNTVYVIETGSSSGDRITMIDTTTNTITGGFALRGEGADVHAIGNQLYVSNVDNEAVDVYDLGGSFVNTLVQGDGTAFNGGDIHDPRQLATTSSGNLLIASGGGLGATGVFEYDLSGTLVNHWNAFDSGTTNSDTMGVIELGNGNILFTKSFDGAWVLDPTTGAITQVAGTAGEDYTFVEFIIPTPGTAALFGLAGLAGIRRRR